MQEKCKIKEFNKSHLFSVTQDGGMYNFIPRKIIEEIAIKCNKLPYSFNVFKIKEDAQRFADIIDKMNVSIEKLIIHYCSNEDFQHQIDEVIIPYLVMDKLVG